MKSLPRNYTVLARAAVLVAAVVSAAALHAQGRFEPRGTYMHEASGTVFPLQVGPFRRLAGIQIYDAEGNDVGVGYRMLHPRGAIELTQFVYPGAATLNAQGKVDACSREFSQADEDIAQVRQVLNIRPVEDLGLRTGRSGLAHGRAYLFAPQGDQPTLRSMLILRCYVNGVWHVKVRVTGPPDADLHREVLKFLEAGPWPRVP